MNLDKVDYEILRELQRNSNISMHELGARVGLSHTPCWRRVKKLEDGGVIKSEVRLLDPVRLGLAVNVLVHVTLRKHQENALARFESATLEIPEIVECYLVSGGTDFLLRVVVADVASYEQLLKSKLVHLPEVGNLNSTFAMRQVKYTTELPLSQQLEKISKPAITTF